MAQRNTENDGMIMGLALVGVAVLIMFAIFYALACFFALILTVIALCAWNENLTIGNWTVTTEEARVFIFGGLAGLVALPVFIVFCQMLFKFHIQPDWWGYIFLGGYSFGALGIGALFAEEQQKQEASKFLTMQEPARPAAPPALPSPPAEPFRFASWDDEAPHDGENER